MTEGGWGQCGGQPGLPAAPGPEWGGEPWELFKGLCCVGGRRMGMGVGGSVWLCGFIAVLHFIRHSLFSDCSSPSLFITALQACEVGGGGGRGGGVGKTQGQGPAP